VLDVLVLVPKTVPTMLGEAGSRMTVMLRCTA